MKTLTQEQKKKLDDFIFLTLIPAIDEDVLDISDDDSPETEHLRKECLQYIINDLQQTLETLGQNEAEQEKSLIRWWPSLTYDQQRSLSMKHFDHGNAEMLSDNDIYIIYLKEHEKQ